MLEEVVVEDEVEEAWLGVWFGVMLLSLLLGEWAELSEEEGVWPGLTLRKEKLG